MVHLLASTVGLAVGITEGVIGAALLVAIIVLAVRLKRGAGQAQPVPEPEGESVQDEEAAAEAPQEEPVPETPESPPAPEAQEETDGEKAPAVVYVAEDGNRIVFAASERSFSEAYATLSEEQKRYFILIREYALHKPNATETRGNAGVTIRSDKKVILKLKIRRGITVASFKLENDLLRDYRRNSESSKAFRLKETELYIEDEGALETARGMVDLMLEQYEKERQEAMERRKAKRAAAAASRRKKAKNEADAEDTPPPADGEE